MEAQIDGDVHIFDKTRVGKITFMKAKPTMHEVGDSAPPLESQLKTPAEFIAEPPDT